MRAASGVEEVPKRLPLVVQPGNRTDLVDKDARLVNCIAEQDANSETYNIIKRPGYGTTSQNISIFGTGYFGSVGVYGNLGHGMYNWSRMITFGGGLYVAQASVIAVYGGNVVNLNTGGVIGTIGTSPDTVFGFVPIPATPTPLLMIGPANWTDGSSMFGVVDPDFPLNPVGNPVYLNGTIYVMDSLGNIQGSQNPNDPSAWNALNTIKTSEGDQGVGLARQLNYVVALSSKSTEFFYDAGNATGSPLAPVQGAKTHIGCVSAKTIQDLDDTLIWVTNDYEGGPRVVALNNLQPTIISTPFVDRLLKGVFLNKTGTTAPNITSSAITIYNHRLYILTINDTNPSPNLIFVNTTYTLVYDSTSQLWYQWTGSTEKNWPVTSVVDTGWSTVVQHMTNGYAYTLDEQFTADNGGLFSADIYTPNFDGGIDRGKMLSRMKFYGDQVPGSVLQVRYSDDDYQTWSAFRNVDMGKKRPILNDCGTFRRRAWHIRHFSPTKSRLRNVDLQMDLCTL